MPTNPTILEDHLRALSLSYVLSLSDDARWLVVHEFKLPPGYNKPHTDVLIEIPSDYPLTPLGVACRTYVAADLRYRGQVLHCFYLRDVPGWGRWGWFCYKSIRWDPHVDNLISFLEMLRADLTNPRTKKTEAPS